MKVLGIVAEYNPFHNGHLYHLKTSKELTGAEYAVAVLSGNYTQRGEPALVDKWARTEMALLSGIDLVIELPVVYAMASAEFFAYGAVRLLDSLGVVNMLSFGSESGKLEDLSEAAAILADEPEEYRTALKNALSSGKSFPAARQKALAAYLKKNSRSDSVSGILKSPNNILGIEYLKALRRLGSSIVPMTIGRVGNDYNSTELSGNISSAASIRKAISDNTWLQARNLVESSMPGTSLAILEREFELGRGPVFPSDFSGILLSTLRKMSLEDMRELPYMENGLENRIKLAAEKAGSYNELVELICTRRYTNTRIQRILFSLLTGLKNDAFQNFNKSGGPPYIRILGFNHKGRYLLSKIKSKTSLPIITKTAVHKRSELPGVADMLRIEAEATDQYVLGYKNSNMRKSGSEFTRSIIFI